MGGVLAIGGIASVFWVLGSLAAAVVVAVWVMLAGGARASGGPDGRAQQSGSCHRPLSS
jgi:hypothetical protein